MTYADTAKEIVGQPDIWYRFANDGANGLAGSGNGGWGATPLRMVGSNYSISWNQSETIRGDVTDGVFRKSVGNQTYGVSGGPDGNMAAWFANSAMVVWFKNTSGTQSHTIIQWGVPGNTGVGWRIRTDPNSQLVLESNNGSLNVRFPNTGTHIGWNMLVYQNGGGSSSSSSSVHRMWLNGSLVATGTGSMPAAYSANMIVGDAHTYAYSSQSGIYVAHPMLLAGGISDAGIRNLWTAGQEQSRRGWGMVIPGS